MLFKLSVKEGTTYFVNFNKGYQTTEAYCAMRTRSIVSHHMHRVSFSLQPVATGKKTTCNWLLSVSVAVAYIWKV